MFFDFTVISIPFTSIPPITFTQPKVLLFHQMIIAEFFPLKFKVTFPALRLTLPVIDVAEAPHIDFTVILSVWSLVTRIKD